MSTIGLIQKRAVAARKSAPSSKRQKSVDDSNGSTLFPKCAKCPTLLLGERQPLYTIHCESECTICPMCFTDVMSNLGCAPNFACPGCNFITSSWSVSCSQPRLDVNGQIVDEVSTANYTLKGPDPVEDPIRHYEASGPNAKFTQIAMASYSKDTGTINKISQVLNTDNCNEWSEEQFRAVESIGMNLHALLVTGDKEGAKKRLDPLAYPTKQALTEVSMSDKTALRRFIHSLATGERLENARTDSTQWEKLVKTTFAAKEIIRHLRSTTQGAVKDIVGAQLHAQDVPNAVFELLNDFGIAPCKEVVVKLDNGCVTMKLEEGLEGFVNDRHCLVITYYDNMGFKQRGTRVGYKQYTKLIHVIVTREELIELGIYPDPANPDQEVKDRTRKKWLEERETNGFNEVCAPVLEDYDRLAETVMLSIDSLVPLVIDGKLPSLEEAKELLEWCNVEWPNTVPDTYGARQLLEGDEDSRLVASSHECESDDEESVVEYESDDEDVKPAAAKQTHLGANNATLDVPMESDLNEKGTCIKMADYKLEFRLELLQIGIKEGDPLKEVIPIMESHGITLAGDGLPSHLFTRIKRENPQKYMDMLNIYFGGFHLGLNGWKGNGKLFSESHLNDVFSLWRFSDKQLAWVMNPGDPNQIEDEMTMCLIAQYVTAINGLIEARKARGDPTVEIKPADVVDHMISRAKENKLCMAALIQLRLTECLFLLLDSESNRDGAKYRTALKFLTIFFCSSHSPKYVSLGSDFFVDWHCSSEADKALFETILFRRTATGRSIFGDRFVEWTIRDLRVFLGDHATGDSHNSLVYRVSLLLNDKKILRNVTKTATSDKATEQRHLRINKVYCEVFVYFTQANIWGVGKPIQVPAKPWKDRKNMNSSEWAENTGTTPSGGAVLNNELCFVFSEGLKRWMEYFRKFLVEGAINDPTRSEKDKGVSLKLVDSTVTERDSREDHAVIRSVSTDHSFVDKKGVYTMEELRPELRALNAMLPQGTPKFRPSSYKEQDKTLKKTHYAKAVVMARKFLIRQDPNWAENRKRTLISQHQQQRQKEESAFQERVDAELNLQFFGFNGCPARNKYNTAYRVVNNSTRGLSTPETRPSMPTATTERSGASNSTGGWGTTDINIGFTP